MRSAYLQLLSEHATSHRLRVLAYSIMTNHVHVVAIPDGEASMANTFRHAHRRFSQYWNTERRKTGHVWQNRYYSCPVEDAAVGRVIKYVEENPVRAGMVDRAEDFWWSSARSHMGATEAEPWLDNGWFAARWTSEDWGTVLAGRNATHEDLQSIREATYLGRPLGSKNFTAELETKLGRRLEARPGGRPKRVVNAEPSTGALVRGVAGGLVPGFPISAIFQREVSWDISSVPSEIDIASRVSLSLSTLHETRL
jgi:putative transposase